MRSIAALVISCLFVMIFVTGSEPRVSAHDRSREVQDEVRTLAGSAQSGVRQPFVFVARSPNALARLREFVQIPDLGSGIDFKNFAIVAAFAGEKPSGGFSVEISSNDGTVTVREKTPPAGTIVTDVLTTPFKVAAIAVQEGDSVRVDLPDAWLSKSDAYTVISGFFSVTGGFAGVNKTINVDGTFKVMWSGDLFSIVGMNIESSDGNRQLYETISGFREGDGWTAEGMEAGDFLERPHPPLVVTADFPGRDLLRLQFTPGKRDYVVNDGYIAKGQLAAKKDPSALSSGGDNAPVDVPAEPLPTPPPPPPAR